VFTRLIDRNTTIPTRKSEVFSTASDSQTSVEVHVLQGEREMAKDNRTLGRFHLVGIPPAPRGVPQIEVTFDIDANGIVNVSAKDRGTGKEQKITITASSGLDDGEIEKMVQDAEVHADDDKARRAQVEVKNSLDSLVYTTEKTLNEHQDKVDAAVKSEIEQALADAKKALEEGDTEAMKQATERLTQSSHKLAEAMYRQEPASAEAGAEAPGGTPVGEEDEVIDAEYVDVEGKSS
jgi:molecular chaperone DnaK